MLPALHDLALLLEQADQQSVRLPRADLFVLLEPLDQSVDVVRHHRKPATSLLAFGVGEVALPIQVARRIARIELRQLRGSPPPQLLEEVRHRLDEQPQAREHRDVRDHMRRVQPLSAEVQTVGLREPQRETLEHLLRPIALHQLLAEVVQSLLAQVGRARLHGQRVVPLQVELEPLQHLLVRQVVPLLEQVQPDQQTNRRVRSPVVRRERLAHHLLVDQRQDELLERLRPRRLQASAFLRRQQELAFEQRNLRVGASEHAPSRSGS